MQDTQSGAPDNTVHSLDSRVTHQAGTENRERGLQQPQPKEGNNPTQVCGPVYAILLRYEPAEHIGNRAATR